MKKNLYVFTLNHPDSAGGVEKVSREIGYGFNESGDYNVHFVFPGEGSYNKVKNGINYISIKKILKIPILQEIIINIKSISLFKKLKNDDIVINNGSFPIFYLLFNKKHFKLVSIAHSSMYCASLSVKKRGLNVFKKWLNIVYNRCYDLLLRPVVKRTDLVITLSKYLKEELIKYYHINPNKIEIVYNGCDMNNEILIPHQKDSPLKVAFIGSNYGGKGLNILEGVAEKMSGENIHFSVIGTNSYAPKIKNIKSLGRVKRDDVYKNMAESDVIFLPSHYEGQPLVILEGMSFGCIPVCSKACHMDMIEMTEFKKFISDKNSVNDYVGIFRNLLVNDYIDDLRNQSKKVASQYTWDKQIKKYIELVVKL